MYNFCKKFSMNVSSSNVTLFYRNAGKNTPQMIILPDTPISFPYSSSGDFGFCESVFCIFLSLQMLQFQFIFSDCSHYYLYYIIIYKLK